jgi:uncharacterized protein (TIGR02145 family)
MNQLKITVFGALLLFWFLSPNFLYGQKAKDNNDQIVSKYITNSKPLKDSRDGKVYQTIKIGKQIWMAENLAFNAKEGSWAYNNDAASVKTHGYLYDWETARNACPEGWELPQRNDFEQLLYVVSKISKKPSKEIIVGGCSGFEALQSGWRNESGDFFDINECGNYWTNSKSISGRSWLLFVGKKGKKSYLDFAPVKMGFSVRCIKKHKN